MGVFFFSLHLMPQKPNIPTLALIIGLLTTKVYAATPETPLPDDFDLKNTLDETLDYLEKTVDEFHEAASKRLLAQSEWVDMNTANWLDNFFSKRRTAIEDNKTHIKLSNRFFIEEGGGTDFDFKFNLKLVLPKTKNKFHFSLTSNDSDDTGIDNTLADDAIKRYERTDRDEGVTASLRYFLKDTDTRNISLRTGVRFSGITPVLVFEPRYRHQIAFDPWMLRFTHFFKWYTDRGVESNSRLDFERPVSKRFFFRFSPDASWFEDDDGWFINANFSLSQILSTKRVINYELNNHFRTNPTSRLEEVAFRIRYRQRIWRKWLFYEIAPQVAFRRESDFETIYGILFELEAFVGWFEK